MANHEKILHSRLIQVRYHQQKPPIKASTKLWSATTEEWSFLRSSVRRKPETFRLKTAQNKTEPARLRDSHERKQLCAQELYYLKLIVNQLRKPARKIPKGLTLSTDIDHTSLSQTDCQPEPSHQTARQTQTYKSPSVLMGWALTMTNQELICDICYAILAESDSITNSAN